MFGRQSWRMALTGLLALLLGQTLAAAPADPRALRIAAGLRLAPYVIEAGPSGLEYAYVSQIMARLGVRLAPVLVPFGEVLHTLEQGRADLAMTVRDERVPGVYFSDEYIQYRDAAMYLANHRFAIKRLADLSGRNISAFQNARTDLGVNFRQAVARASHYEEVANQLQQNYKLYTGKVEVVVSDVNIFSQLNTQLPAGVDVTQRLETAYLFAPTRYRVGFRDPALRDRFNQALRSMRHDPALAELLSNWQPVFVSPLNEIILFPPAK